MTSTIDQLVKRALQFEEHCNQELVALAKTKKLPNSKDLPKDNNLVEEEKVIDLMGAIDFSYSAIMREMRQQTSKDQLHLFMSLFKKEFDKAVKNKLQKPEKVALQNSLIKFNKKHKVKVKKKLVKNAAVTELGDPVLVGKYLSDIVKFTISRIPPEKRSQVLNTLRDKFYSFNANEIASKELPATSGIGQSITFVKHVLFNHDARYIREVLNNLARNL